MMETKKSKYDTNPLDPDVEKKAEESWGGPPTERVGGATSEVGNENARKNVYSEAPTRRYDNPPLEAPYPSVFVPPTYAPPTQYQPQANVGANPYQSPVTDQTPTLRHIPGLGIGEKWALMLPYAPWIGIVASLVELFLVPRREVRVRFHASQALALHLAILILSTILGVVGDISDNHFGKTIFTIASTVFLVISMVRVSRGEAHRITPLAEPAKWFNQHIEPRSQG